MSNIATKQFTPMNTNYAQLNQPSVQIDKSLELSPSMDSMNKFLKDSSPAPKENSVPMNKESLEKLFAMFEFAVKAMRSMLAGMGVLPKLPGELDAQTQVKPGLDGKSALDGKPGHDGKSALDGKPGHDGKSALDGKPGHDGKSALDGKPGHDGKSALDGKPGHDGKSGLDGKATVDAGEQTKGTLEADAKVAVKPGSEVKVMQDKNPVQLTISPDGKLNSRHSTTIPNDLAQRNRLSSDINVTVQVQNCHCPHTGEKVTPQPPVTPTLDKQPSPQPPVTPALDKQPSPQPPVTPALDKQPSPQPAVTPGLDTKPSPQPPVTPPTPDLTCPAPDDLVDDFTRHTQTRFDNHRANRPSLRSRF